MQSKCGERMWICCFASTFQTLKIGKLILPVADNHFLIGVAESTGSKGLSGSPIRPISPTIRKKVTLKWIKNSKNICNQSDGQEHTWMINRTYLTQTQNGTFWFTRKQSSFSNKKHSKYAIDHLHIYDIPTAFISLSFVSFVKMIIIGIFWIVLF